MFKTSPNEALRIGALAAQTGTTAPTVRYYEEIGLLPPAGRQEGGQRRYGAEDVRRLTFIRRCREFGFSVDQVRDLVALVEDPGRDCTAARDIGQAHLDAVRARLAELQALERSIADFVDQCATTCAGGPGPDCVPLAQLATAPARGRPASAPAGSEAAVVTLDGAEARGGSLSGSHARSRSVSRP